MRSQTWALLTVRRVLAVLAVVAVPGRWSSLRLGDGLRLRSGLGLCLTLRLVRAVRRVLAIAALWRWVAACQLSVVNYTTGT